MRRRRLASVEALNQTDAARVAGMSRDNFAKLATRDPYGAPPRRPDGCYDLEELGAWIRERTAPRPQEAGAEGLLDPMRERARKDKEMADRYALENRVRRGELIEAETVIAAGRDMAATVRARLLRLPDHLAMLLAGQDDPVRVRSIVDDSVRDALTELSVTWVAGEDWRTGNSCPTS